MRGPIMLNNALLSMRRVCILICARQLDPCTSCSRHRKIVTHSVSYMYLLWRYRAPVWRDRALVFRDRALFAER